MCSFDPGVARPAKHMRFPDACTWLLGTGTAPSLCDEALLIAGEFLVHRGTSRAGNRQSIRDAIGMLPFRDRTGGFVYEDWLEKARTAARSICQPTGPDDRARRTHHLYVILRAIEREGQYVPGLYVGVTRRKPAARLQQHLAGGRLSARTLRETGVCLLPSFYQHLNPLPRAVAEALEPKLADAMRRAVGTEFARRIKGPTEQAA